MAGGGRRANPPDVLDKRLIPRLGLEKYKMLELGPPFARKEVIKE